MLPCRHGRRLAQASLTAATRSHLPLRTAPADRVEAMSMYALVIPDLDEILQYAEAV